VSPVEAALSPQRGAIVVEGGHSPGQQSQKDAAALGEQCLVESVPTVHRISQGPFYTQSNGFLSLFRRRAGLNRPSAQGEVSDLSEGLRGCAKFRASCTGLMVVWPWGQASGTPFINLCPAA
jgi:hypothetical protein